MKTIKRCSMLHLIFQMVATLAVSPLLYLAEFHISGTVAAASQAMPITLMGTLFVAFAAGSFSIYSRIASNGGKSIIAYYLTSKCLSMLLALGSIAVYGVAATDGHVALFALNVMALYVVFLVNSSLLYASVERKLKKMQ